MLLRALEWLAGCRVIRVSSQSPGQSFRPVRICEPTGASTVQRSPASADQEQPGKPSPGLESKSSRPNRSKSLD